MLVVLADPISRSAEVRDIEHGDSIDELSVVAVIDGTLCPCKWCTNLVRRIASETCHSYDTYRLLEGLRIG